MDIFINTDKSPALIQAKATGSPLSAFKVKRGAVVPLSVTILDSSSASGLRMGIKAKGNYEGDLLILAEAESGTQTKLGTRFDLKLVASSLALNDALDVGEGKESTPATLAAMTESAWKENGGERLSSTINTTLLNDIIRLAMDAPESATGEYPAPDLVATKSWVNSKQASVDTSGFVMLGTDETISGKNARPIGKTSSGSLAVDISGLSAYDIAKDNGFVGTEEAWLVSLKGERGAKGEQGEPGIQGVQGEPGEVDPADVDAAVHKALYEEQYETHTSAVGTTDINCRWAQLSLAHCPPGGNLKSVTIPCRSTNSSDMTTAASYLGIFEEDASGNFVHLATSVNTVAQKVGQDSVWQFEETVLSGTKIRPCLMASRTSTALNTSLVLSGRGVNKDTDGCYLMNTSASNLRYGINPADCDEFEMKEIADTLNTYEENKAYADSYRKELEAGEESDNGYHEFLQGMADREIISLYENYGIVTNIKIEGWEPASR